MFIAYVELLVNRYSDWLGEIKICQILKVKQAVILHIND